MKAYKIKYQIYYDNEAYDGYSDIELRESPRHEEYSGTDFDGLWNLVNKHLHDLAFDVCTTATGKQVMYYRDWPFFKNITRNNCKPWKFVITNEETTISMNQLMQFNADQVIQYLKERGMAACPILK